MPGAFSEYYQGKMPWPAIMPVSDATCLLKKRGLFYKYVNYFKGKTIFVGSGPSLFDDTVIFGNGLNRLPEFRGICLPNKIGIEFFYNTKFFPSTR